MRSFVRIIRDAWVLARPYFRSEEKWSARLLLVTIIVMNLALVGMDVVLNFWNGAFYDSLQNHDWKSFIALLFYYRHGSEGGFMPGFCGVAAVYIFIAVYRTYLNQWLQIRWRRWLTRHLLEDWLSDRAYYHISLTASRGGTGTDNPDQRIAEDLRSFVGDTLALGLDLLSNVVSLASFVGILWSLSGPPIVIYGVAIHGYMVWVALLYAIVGTWLTHLVGRPLALLSFQQQRYEADFRFSLVRLRENAEGVALYGGEQEERAGIATRFGSLMQNWWAIMQRTKFLNALVSSYQQIAVVFPIIVAAPRYFSGAMALGGLTRTASAFGQVQGAMSWVVSSYASLASWSATVERLATFQRSIAVARASHNHGVALDIGHSGALELQDVTLNLPNGQTLLEHQSLSLPAGETVLITGASGTGKSTLFRAIAGIWPYGSGRVTRPSGRALFLPQRPYIPLGTLRHAIAYPAPDSAFDDATMRDVLRDVGLGNLVEQLGSEANWSLRLSGGEQQRLAFARALLNRPDWLFLDEATASLEPAAEAELYHVLRRHLPDSSIISIAHHRDVAGLHDREIVFERAGGSGGKLRQAETVE